MRWEIVFTIAAPTIFIGSIVLYTCIQEMCEQQDALVWKVLSTLYLNHPDVSCSRLRTGDVHYTYNATSRVKVLASWNWRDTTITVMLDDQRIIGEKLQNKYIKQYVLTVELLAKVAHIIQAKQQEENHREQNTLIKQKNYLEGKYD